MFRFRRVLSTVAVVLAASLAPAGLSPVAAETRAESGAGAGVVTETGRAGDHESSAVEFEITGRFCETEIVSVRTRPNGTVVLKNIRRGTTDSSIALLTGDVTVESTEVIRPDGRGRVSGRWTLEPAASTGSIKGTIRGSLDGPDTAQLVSRGRGVAALHGVSVTMETASPAAVETDGCKPDLTFAGTGTARYREPRNPVGAVVVTSNRAFDDTVSALTEAIEGNPNLNLALTVDHQAAAAGRGLTLAPTTELFFGNPGIGTPLMQSAQTTGIDLPQKMLVWEDLVGVVRVGYNAPSYLRSRHDIEGAEGQLQTIANALAGLAGVATDTTVEPVFDAGTVRRRAGLIKVGTDLGAEDAYAAIVDAVDAAPPVNVALKLEHDVNARSVGLDLRPTKLVVFGNPSLGTTLMQTNQSIALDLPQKILVYTDEQGQTYIAYNKPAYIARRHDVRRQSPTLRILAGALANFAAAGT